MLETYGYDSWRKVTEHPEWVDVRVPRSRDFDRWVRLVFVCIVAGLFLLAAWRRGGDDLVFWGIAIAIALFLALFALRAFIEPPPRQRLLARITDGSDDDDDNVYDAYVIPSSELAALEVLERRPRSEHEMGLVRVFAHYRDRKKTPFLVFQTYRRSRDDAMALADRLGRRWQVPVVDESSRTSLANSEQGG